MSATCPAGSGNSVANAITAAVGAQPTGTDNHTFNYLDLVNYLAVGNLNPSPLGYVGGSDVFTTITPAAAQGDDGEAETEDEVRRRHVLLLEADQRAPSAPTIPRSPIGHPPP